MTTKLKCCLLLEDDPEDQELFMDTLRATNDSIGCYAVTNGEEALGVILNEGFRPDFIFTDINMPVMDGIKFVRTIREIEQYKLVPIVILSSGTSETVVETAESLDAVFCNKGDPTALRKILEHCFGRR